MVVDIWLYSEKRNCKSLSRIRPFATPWTIPPAPGLLCPWHSPGRNTGVGCHFLLQRIFFCCSVTKLCLTLLLHGPRFARLPCPSLSPGICFSSYVHWVGDAIQPSHPLSPPSPPALNLSQHQGLFQWVSFLLHVAKLLKPQHASGLPMDIQGWFPLGLTGLVSLLSKGLESLLQHHSSKASVLQCSAFFMVHLSHRYMTTGKTMTV